MGPCLCGDTECPSCGTLQGTRGSEMNLVRHVLDHGHVRLVSFMQPALGGRLDISPQEIVDDWDGDLEVVRNARNSFNAAHRAGEDEDKDSKLLNYLYSHRHTTPFEAMVFTFDIKCPIFVARQWHRHRTWSYNEVSARYTMFPEEFYLPDVEYVGTQSTSNKQQRIIESNPGLTPEAAAFVNELQEHSIAGFRLYKEYLSLGVPRELARCFLAVNTYTHFFGTVDMHNLFHFLRLRLHSHAQYEIRVYAEAILELIRQVAPDCVHAFEESLA